MNALLHSHQPMTLTCEVGIFLHVAIGHPKNLSRHIHCLQHTVTIALFTWDGLQALSDILSGIPRLWSASWHALNIYSLSYNLDLL